MRSIKETLPVSTVNLDKEIIGACLLMDDVMGNNTKMISHELLINGKPVTACVDTGTYVSVINHKLVSKD